MGYQNESPYLVLDTRPWRAPGTLPARVLPELARPLPDAEKNALSRDQLQWVAVTAAALRASLVVTPAGWVVHDANPCLAPDEQPENAICLVIAEERLRASDPDCDRELQAALRHSLVTESQCIGPANFKALIMLRRLDFAGTPLIFIRTRQVDDFSEQDLVPLVRAFNLTRTERTVLRLLSNGQSPESVAEQLNVAISTVRSHIKNLLEKTASPDLRRLLICVCRTLG